MSLVPPSAASSLSRARSSTSASICGQADTKAWASATCGTPRPHWASPAMWQHCCTGGSAAAAAGAREAAAEVAQLKDCLPALPRAGSGGAPPASGSSHGTWPASSSGKRKKGWKGGDEARGRSGNDCKQQAPRAAGPHSSPSSSARSSHAAQSTFGCPLSWTTVGSNAAAAAAATAGTARCGGVGWATCAAASGMPLTVASSAAGQVGGRMARRAESERGGRQARSLPAKQPPASFESRHMDTYSSAARKQLQLQIRREAGRQAGPPVVGTSCATSSPIVPGPAELRASR